MSGVAEPGGVDDDAFRLVFDRCLPAARRVAQRMTGDAAVAEEIAAEALTRLYARWWRLARHPNLDAWVMRVTSNLAIGHLRRRRPLPTAPMTTPDGEELSVLRMGLADALARLPRRQREVVVLRYLSDLSEADVAAALGVSPGSVKTHLHRALATLRDGAPRLDLLTGGTTRDDE